MDRCSRSPQRSEREARGGVDVVPLGPVLIVGVAGGVVSTVKPRVAAALVATALEAVTEKV